MLSKILGLLDLLVSLIIILSLLDKENLWFPKKIILIAGVYLLLKGLLFIIFLDFASIADIISSVIILMSITINIAPLIMIIIIIFLIQKAFFSMTG